MRVQLRVEKLVYGGDGLARYGDSVVFVPYVLPGEEVVAELSSASGSVFRGSPVGWTARSPDRAEPRCPVFTRCGGCHYQHIPYERQCAIKVEILRETLRRIGGLRWKAEIEVVAANPWGYRNRTQLSLETRGGVTTAGFLAARSHRHVAVQECAINSPKLNALLHAVQECLSDLRFPSRFRAVELFTNERQVQINLPRRPARMPRGFWARCADRLGVRRPGKPLEYRCGEDLFRVSGRSFFQVNRFLVDRLAGVVIGPAEGRLALDLYCGVGLLTLPLARRFKTVAGVDSSASATRDLQFNARRAGLPLRAVQAKVRDYLEAFDGRPDLVVADPPRAGLGGALVRQLLRAAPERLHLVSCDPATLARDIKSLEAGGYSLQRLVLLDFFRRPTTSRQLHFSGWRRPLRGIADPG